VLRQMLSQFVMARPTGFLAGHEGLMDQQHMHG